MRSPLRTAPTRSHLPALLACLGLMTACQSSPNGRDDVAMSGPSSSQSDDEVIVPQPLGQGRSNFGPVRGLAAGADHTCALLQGGRTQCWGANAQRELGSGDNKAVFRQPVLLSGMDHIAQPSHIATGKSHTCAVVPGGVACLGDNSYAQLGADPQKVPNRDKPKVLEVSAPVRELVAGEAHTCALMADGQVACFGYNVRGQLGQGDAEQLFPPSLVKGFSQGIDLVAGASHTCGARRDGSVLCWGDNTHHQLGLGAERAAKLTMQRAGVPMPVAGVSEVTQLAAAANKTCALASGQVWCWGEQAVGEISDAAKTHVPEPVRLEGLSQIIGVAAGASHVCALTQSGEVWCRRGINGARATLERVALASAATQLVSGETHACALIAEGAVQCWGDNVLGQLGNFSDVRSDAPVFVAFD